MYKNRDSNDGKGRQLRDEIICHRPRRNGFHCKKKPISKSDYTTVTVVDALAIGLADLDILTESRDKTKSRHEKDTNQGYSGRPEIDETYYEHDDINNICPIILDD